MACQIHADADCVRLLFFGEVLELKFEDGVVKARGLHGEALGLAEDSQELCDLLAQALSWFEARGLSSSP